MSLDKKIIKDGIKDLQKNPPRNVNEAAKKWAALIYKYALGGLAGVAIPMIPGKSTGLEVAFKATMNGQVFLETLGTSLQPMWAAAIWAGPGFTGVTAAAVGSALDISMKGVAALVMAGADGPTEISNAIDTWTKTITVTLTNIASGATSVSPVS